MFKAAPENDMSRPVLCLALVGLIVLHGAANAWWLARDNHAYHADEAMHMGHARDHYATLFLDRQTPLGDRLAAAFEKSQYYPPLLHLLGAAFIRLLGYHPDHIALSMTPVLAILLVGSYFVARELFTRRGALLATLIVSLCPLVFGCSRLFMTDYLSAALVVWAIYALIRSDGLGNLGWTIAFALVAGLAMLARQTSLVFLLVPGASAVLIRLLATVRFPRVDWRTAGTICRNTALALGLTLAIMSPWYIYHSDSLLGFWVGRFGERFFNLPSARALSARDLAYGAVLCLAIAGIVYAFRAARARLGHLRLSMPPAMQMLVCAFLALLSAYGLLQAGEYAVYAEFLVEHGGFPHILLLALAGALLIVHPKRITVPLLLVAFWAIGSYVLLTLLFRTRVPRYIMPAAPAIGLLATYALYHIPHTRTRRLVVAGTVAFSLVQYACLTTGLPGLQGALRLPKAMTGSTGIYGARGGYPVLKERLILGNYAVHSAQREAGFADHVMRAMVKDMRERKPIHEEWANYQLLTNMHQFEGTEFVRFHYWPDHPFALASETRSPVKLRALGNRWQRDPSDLGPNLDATDFVLIRVGFDPDAADGKRQQARAEALEADWQRHLGELGFETVDHFYRPRYSLEAGGNYTVMGRALKDRVITRRWDLTQATDESGEWEFVRETGVNREGTTQRLHESGPAMYLRGAPVEMADVSVVRIEISSTTCGEDSLHGDVGPEDVIFYWANPRHVYSGETPFSNNRSARLYPVRSGVWETRVAKEHNWAGTLEQAMVVMNFGFAGQVTQATIATWDFTKPSSGAEDWSVQWPHDPPSSIGTVVRADGNGPLAMLSTSVDCSTVDYVETRLYVRARGNADAPPRPVHRTHIYWASEEDTEHADWPFSPKRGLELAPVDGEPGTYRALVRNRSSWAGRVEQFMLGVDLPRDAGESSAGGFDVVLQEISIGRFVAAQPGACAAYDVTTRAITFAD